MLSQAHSYGYSVISYPNVELGLTPEISQWITIFERHHDLRQPNVIQGTPHDRRSPRKNLGTTDDVVQPAWRL